MTKIFTIWRFVISLGLAKSGIWETTCSDEKRIYLFTFHILSKNGNKALNLIIGPLSIIISFV